MKKIKFKPPKLYTILELPSWPEDVAGRRHNAMVKKSLQFVLVDHHANVIPDHFKPEAKGRYGYEPRTLAYVRRKLRRWGHNDPLTYSGRSRSQITRGRPKITLGGSATERTQRAVLHMRFNFFGGSGKSTAEGKGRSTERTRAQRSIDELTAVTDQEIRKMAKLLRDEYAKQLEEFRRTRKRKIIRKT